MIELFTSFHFRSFSMRTVFACVLSVFCFLCLAAEWPSPLAIDASGNNKYVFFGKQSQHVTLAVDGDHAWVGARSKEGIYGWAIIAEADGTARLQVRDEKGESVNVDLLKAARILRSLGAGGEQ
jgi:hypothetical protein